MAGELYHGSLRLGIRVCGGLPTPDGFFHVTLSAIGSPGGEFHRRSVSWNDPLMD